MGADAGFASIIGLAVLVLLYFAQARETASLREQAELSAQRVAQLESRIAAAVRASPAPNVAPPPGVQPPPSFLPRPGNPPGSGIAAAATPSPPAGVAAPPLSAATKLIPTPTGVAGLSAARIAASSGRAPVAAASAGAPPVAAPGPAVPPVGAPPAGMPSAGAPGGMPSAGAPAVGASPVAAPGPVAPPVGAPSVGAPPVGAPSVGAPPEHTQVASPPGSPPSLNRVVTPRPATAAGAASATNGVGEHPIIPPPSPVPPRKPVTIRPGASSAGRPSMLADLDAGKRSSSNLTRILTALAAVAVVAAIVIVLISVTSNGTSNHTSSHASTPVSNAPVVHHPARVAKPAPVNNASVTVAVLNGTAVYHLADNIATQLSAAGFKQGTVANAASQTQPSTTVEYMSGDVRDAQAVARSLKLSSAAVQPITPDTQTLCAQTTTCTAQVVVTLGADLANTQQTQTTP